VLESIRQAGTRAIIQGWDDALRGAQLPETIYHAGSMPHTWLFDQASLVVHHGGFGTTAAALRSGAPSLVVAHIIDQFYWGQRVTELGVGPKFIPRGNLSVEKLTAAIRQALTDGEMRVKATGLGRQIQAEPDGVAAAVAKIEAAFEKEQALKV
jgi:UDP:flavonoid glycosyltransferase YjiC (YdhE family)